MFYQNFKKIVCLILCLKFTFCYADNGSDFLYHSKAIVNEEREVETPGYIFNLYHSDLLVKNIFVNSIVSRFNSNWQKMISQIDVIIDEVKQTTEKINSKNVQEMSLDDYGKLIQKKQELALKLENLKHLFNETRNSAKTLNEQNIRNLYDNNYCQLTSNLINSKNLSVSPTSELFKLPIQTPFTHYTPIEGFQSDPKVNAVGWLSFSASTIGLLAAAVAWQGFGILTDITLTAANGSIALTGTGPAAVIIIAAAIIATIAVSWFNKHENDKRRAEAMAKYRILKAVY